VIVISKINNFVRYLAGILVKPIKRFPKDMDNGFKPIYKTCRNYSMTSVERMYALYNAVKYVVNSNIPGDFVECGVWKGGSSMLMAHTLLKMDAARKIYLYDTFAGMPAKANVDPAPEKEGDFGDITLDAIKDYLKPFPFVVFHPGIIPETLEAAKETSFAFVHIDVDLYITAMECCEFFYNRMVSAGVLIFDDYGFSGYKYAAKRAIDEFFHDKRESPITLPTGQCIVIKL